MSRESIRRGKGFAATVLWGLLAFLGGTCLVWLVGRVAAGRGIREGLLAVAGEYETARETQLGAIASALQKDDRRDEVIELGRHLMTGRGALYWVPASVTIRNAIIDLFAHGVARLVLPKGEGPFYRRRSIRDLVLPGFLMWVFLGAAAALFVTLVTRSGLSPIPSNVLIVTLALFSLQGLAVVWHWVQRSVLLRRAAFAVLAVLTVLLFVKSMSGGVGLAVFGILLPGIVALGVFDTWFDYRKIDRADA